jgi:hypothetical protein
MSQYIDVGYLTHGYQSSPAQAATGDTITIKQIKGTQQTITAITLQDLIDGLPYNCLPSSISQSGNTTTATLPSTFSGSLATNLFAITINNGTIPNGFAGIILITNIAGNLNNIVVSPASVENGDVVTISSSANTLDTFDTNSVLALNLNPVGDLPVTTSTAPPGPPPSFISTTFSTPTSTSLTFTAPTSASYPVTYEIWSTYDYVSDPYTVPASKTVTYFSLGTITITGSPSPDPPGPVCFKEGSKILCFINDVEREVKVEDLEVGMMVKTSLDGYLPIKVVGSSLIKNRENDERTKDRLYRLSKARYPELNEDLYVTGCHAILVDSISEKERRGIVSHVGRIFVTDRKYRLIACVDGRAEPFVSNSEKEFAIYHIALGNNSRRNYGIYANNLLVESCFESNLNSSKMNLKD